MPEWQLGPTTEPTPPSRKKPDFSNWQPGQPEGNPRSLEFLSSALILPNGVRLEARAPEDKGGGASYALVTKKSGQEMVTFDLDIMFRAAYVPLLQNEIDIALRKAIDTGKPQWAAFRDPDAE